MSLSTGNGFRLGWQLHIILIGCRLYYIIFASKFVFQEQIQVVQNCTFPFEFDVCYCGIVLFFGGGGFYLKCKSCTFIYLSNTLLSSCSLFFITTKCVRNYSWIYKRNYDYLCLFAFVGKEIYFCEELHYYQFWYYVSVLMKFHFFFVSTDSLPCGTILRPQFGFNVKNIICAENLFFF